MGGQATGQAEGVTEPKASSLPETTLDLAAQYPIKNFAPSEDEVKSLQLFHRASCYIAASMIFLTTGSLDPKKDLKKEHVKKRLLGHWGTCPGISLIQAHMNLLISKLNQKMLYLVGSGHGAPGYLASLYIEGSMSHFYDKYGMDKEGYDNIIRAFSWPGGLPSHVNAESPGAIHEGGELGYALSVAFGSIMDSPDLITVVEIGDGEAESGPTAGAWHAHKFIDPAESGMVLPILHANGFKISERTLYGCMDDKELVSLFTGFGWQPIIVSYGQNLSEESEEKDRLIHINLGAAMNWAISRIKEIQEAARSGKPMVKPRWPMIVLRSPKGWTGPKIVDKLPVVNSFRAHQVPLTKAATDDTHFKQLTDWLASYKPEELFDANSSCIIRPEVRAIVPKDKSLQIGLLKESYNNYQRLDLPDWKKYGTDTKNDMSPMKAVGLYLKDVVSKNPKTFRIFSPDELRSNKLDAVFDVTTRNQQTDPETANKGGRVIEMLSEHTLQGFLQGYTLTGRTGLFPSYEAFLSIVDTMIEQFAKFRKTAMETSWRKSVPSLNYIETSTLWRQEHNGYSHQAPGLINCLLPLPRHLVRIYLPPDANCAVSVIDHCLASSNYVNLIVGSKQPGRNWLNANEAERHCTAGISVWEKYSIDNGVDPDVVLVSSGVEVTTETIHAAAMLRKDLPQLRVRVVNIVDLLVLEEPGPEGHPHALTNDAFDSIFTKDKPVVIAFHGFPSAVASLISGRGSGTAGRSRFKILGYIEEGTTTTPYSMLRLNKVGRYDIAQDAIRGVLAAGLTNKIDTKAHAQISYYQHENRKLEKYALEHGDDPDDFKTAPLFEA